MSVRRLYGAAVVEALFEGNVIPAQDVLRTQMIDGRERIQFVQAWDNSPVFNLRQTADVQNEFRAPPARRQLIASPFYLSIG